MNSSEGDAQTPWVDPDDEPELCQEWFDSAAVMQGDKVIGPGRPGLATPKVSVTLRLDADIATRLRDSGPGWQTRVNEALRAMLQLTALPESKK